MTRIRVLLLVVLLASLHVVSGFAADETGQSTWAFGYVTWVGESPPSDASAIGELLDDLAVRIFDLWNLPLPSEFVPQSAEQTASSNLWEDASLAALFGSAQLTWNGTEIAPLEVVIFPDIEALNAALHRYDIGGLYTDTPLIETQPWVEPAAYTYAAPAILVAQDRLNGTLAHELAHWVYSQWLRVVTPTSYEEADRVRTSDVPASITSMLVEGFAEYTAWALGEKESPQPVAACWSAEGGLTDVPPPLHYAVGASLFNSLLPESVPVNLPWWLLEYVSSWEAVTEEIESDWRGSLADIEPSEADRVDTLVQRQLLSVCRRLLDPVLVGEAASALDRLHRDNRSFDDVDRFWASLSDLPSPDEKGWEKLALREWTYGIVAKRLGHPDLIEFAAQQSALGELRAARNWEAYRTLMIAMLREGIARWGL